MPIISVHIYLLIKMVCIDLVASKIYQLKTVLSRSITLISFDSTQATARKVRSEQFARRGQEQTWTQSSGESGGV